jgi:hypothetical protein
MGRWPQNWKKYSLLRHERVGFLQGAHAVSGAFGNRLVSEARGKGSHRILEHPGFPDFTFAFHDSDGIGPRMLARIAKHTGLKPSDL